jgi:uncharacterized membrane protein HdeD (DUF308 family)
MDLGILLIVLGIVLWLLVAPTIGLILVVVGVVLLLVGATSGWSAYRR